MAVLILVFTISLSLLDGSGVTAFKLADEVEFNSPTSWLAIATVSFVSVFIFKAIALTASYLKRR